MHAKIIYNTHINAKMFYNTHINAKMDHDIRIYSPILLNYIEKRQKLGIMIGKNKYKLNA